MRVRVRVRVRVRGDGGGWRGGEEGVRTREAIVLGWMEGRYKGSNVR